MLVKALQRLAFCTLILFMGQATADASRRAPPVVLEEGRGSYSLGRHLGFAVEGAGWSIEKVGSPAFASRFERSTAEVPSFGFTHEAYWFRLALESGLTTRHELFLEIPYPVLDHVEIFVERADGTFARHVMGDTYPHGNKLIPHPNFVIPLSMEPGERRRVFFRAKTEGSLQLPLNLWTAEAFVAETARSQLFLGLLFGFMLIMVLYNLFIYLAVRDRSYLYYEAFVVGISVWQASVYGHAQQYLWPTLPWLAQKAYCWAIYLTSLAVLLFTKAFLDLKRYHPRWNRMLNLLLAASVLGTVVTPFLPYRYTILGGAGLGALGPFFCVVAGVLALRRGYRPARYYLIAWSAFLVAVSLFAANKFGIIPRNLVTEHASLLGSALNAVLLSFSLGDRINSLRQEKEQAQSEALQVQRRAAEDLEREVESRTQDLKQAFERLAEHDRLKSRFFANVSHEVRTPLTLILTPLQRLLAGEGSATPVPEAVKDRLRSMRDNVQRLLRHVNQLLDFSRLESGGTTVSFERAEIGPVVESIVKAFEPFAQGKGLRLNVSQSESLPATYVDVAKLDKVVSNLLSNACKFTEPGGEVSVQLAADERTLSIAVRDTGIGIPVDELSRVFERFRQVDGSAARRHEGTGIGLALSRELAALMGGALEAESEPGVGSVFTLTLPLGKAHIKDPSLIREEHDEGRITREMLAAHEASAALGAETGQREPAIRVESAAAPEEAAPGRPLVLVVEDNPDMRGLLREICQREFQVREARDGREGLELAEQLRPALVISDVMMPVMDGYALLEGIRSHPAIATTPVMLLTARTGSEMLVAGLESGANDYLSKPFEEPELLARARNLVQMEQQRQQLSGINLRLQEEVLQRATELERARMLGRYLPPDLVRAILDGREEVQVSQQRSQLTVFLVELRGFNLMVEQLAPEETTAMLNGYLSAMMDLALEHGATVDRLNHEVVGGFFGAPTSEGVDRDAIRCAQMAVAMRRRAAEICDGWRRNVRMTAVPTIVLASGFATVGNFGSSRRVEYTAVGGPVNQTGELMPAVPSGAVACTHPTFVLIEGSVPVTPWESVKAPHWQNPVDLYRFVIELDPGDSTLDIPSSPAAASSGSWTPSSQRAVRSLESPAGTRQASDALAPDTVIADRYRVIRGLGKGGMSVVYQVRDLRLDSDVALKVLKESQDQQPIKYLRKEVKLARLVSHRNVARIYDLGACEDFHFITLEYIDGRSLAEELRSGGALDLEPGTAILRQICDGLGAAHLAGIVHRDLKPSNVMLEASGRAVILDFGVARWASSVRHDDTATSFLGTPRYMAPEQFKGEPVDRRSDIYSLGCLAFEMFVGQKLFAESDPTTLGYQHVHVQPPHPQQVRPDLPPRLAALILRCLRKEPAERFDRVEEISALLDGALPEGRRDAARVRGVSGPSLGRSR
jgi:signal transduction histidine kinase/DNA-binding response OmpR family regulator/predicted Ser/Thr protein kinase